MLYLFNTLSSSRWGFSAGDWRRLSASWSSRKDHRNITEGDGRKKLTGKFKSCLKHRPSGSDSVAELPVKHRSRLKSVLRRETGYHLEQSSESPTRGISSGISFLVGRAGCVFGRTPDGDAVCGSGGRFPRSHTPLVGCWSQRRHSWSVTTEGTVPRLAHGSSLWVHTQSCGWLSRGQCFFFLLNS